MFKPLTFTIDNYEFYNVMIVKNPLVIIQTINLIICLISITVGIKNYKSPSIVRILIFIPIFSFSQILISETLSALNPTVLYFQVSFAQKILVILYSILEFLIIIIFLAKDTTSIKTKLVLIIICILLEAVAIVEMIIKIKKREEITLDYFYVMEGILLLVYISNDLIKFFNKNELNQVVKNDVFIAKTGILLSFSVFWPSSLIQNLVLKNIKILHSYFFISNSIGYLIMFVFFSISFYASRKSRIN